MKTLILLHLTLNFIMKPFTAIEGQIGEGMCHCFPAYWVVWVYQRLHTTRIHNEVCLARQPPAGCFDFQRFSLTNSLGAFRLVCSYLHVDLKRKKNTSKS